MCRIFFCRCYQEYVDGCFAEDDCVEDIQENLRSEIQQTTKMNISSADTILRIQKELATATRIIYSKAEIDNQFNTNEKLNILNLSTLKKANVFKSHKYYDLDFDNQFVFTEEYDAKMGYKMVRGYFHSVA